MHNLINRLFSRGGGMADAQDLKSCVTLVACGFESHPRHLNYSEAGV